ncbi:hypothetical protein G6F22_016152 [Rhizopus arrhizus]|nr:hypothetical protein G6F22_016152 [Rhizopus arrhizus]
MGRPARGRHAAQQLAVAVRRRCLAVGAAPRAVLPAQLPGRPAGPELPSPGRAAGDPGQRALLAGSRPGEPAVPGAPARAAGRVPGGGQSRRDLLGGLAGHHRRVHPRRPPAHGLQLRAAGGRLQRGLHPRHGLAPGSGDDRRLAVLGGFESRRGTGGQPLGRPSGRPAPGADAGGDAVLAAWLGLPVPGRGAGPGRGRGAVRGPAGPLRHHLLAELQGP